MSANPITQAQAIVGAVVGLLLLIAAGFGIWKVNDWRERANGAEAKTEELTDIASATEATAAAFREEQADARRVEIVVSAGRAEASRAIEALEHEDPSVAALRATPVPDGLRRVWLARREARERVDGPAGAGDRARGDAGAPAD